MDVRRGGEDADGAAEIGVDKTAAGGWHRESSERQFSGDGAERVGEVARKGAAEIRARNKRNQDGRLRPEEGEKKGGRCSEHSGNYAGFASRHDGSEIGINGHHAREVAKV